MTDATLTGCPDGGHCHHQCATACFRVGSCGPLSGVYSGDRWPDEVLQAHGHPERAQGTRPDLAATRAQVGAAVKSALIAYAGEDTYLLVRTGEIAAVAVAAAEPALLALVDAQAARIDKALAAIDGVWTFGPHAALVEARRALTEDVTP